MIGRSAEVVKTSGRRQLDVVAIQEVRYKNEGVRSVKGEFEYRLYWSGDEKAYDGETGSGKICYGYKSESKNP